MKIVIATPLFPPELGPPAKYVFTLAKKLKENHVVHVVTYANHYETIEGVRITSISKQYALPIRLFHYTRELIRCARTADILYVQRAAASGLPAIITHWLTKVPVVINYIEDEAWERLQHTKNTEAEHQGAFRRIKKIPGAIWLIWHIQHFVLTHAHSILVPSNFLAQELHTAYNIPQERFGILFTPFSKKLSLPFPPQPQRFIFMNTTLFPWKDVATAMRAVTLLAKIHPDIKLLIAGDGPSREELEKSSHMEPYRIQTTFLGRISSAETQYHLANAAVFLCTSTFEENPDILFDAFREKVPVVATTIPGLREGFIHEESGLGIPPANAQTCAEALKRVLEDKELRTHLTSHAFELLQKKFSWERHVQTLLEQFKKIV